MIIFNDMYFRLKIVLNNIISYNEPCTHYESYSRYYFIEIRVLYWSLQN